MKKTLKYIISLLLIIIFNRVTRWVIVKIKYVLPFVYGVYIQKSINKVGNGMYVQYPFILVGGKYITIGENFASRSGFRIEAWDNSNGKSYKPEIEIGDNVIFNFDCHIGAINKVVIGNNVLVASRVFITDHSHGDTDINSLMLPPAQRPLFSKGPVIIGENVWIGEGVAILPNVRIGKNSIIGANSVVTSDIPENSVAAGIPARIIKRLEIGE